MQGKAHLDIDNEAGIDQFVDLLSRGFWSGAAPGDKSPRHDRALMKSLRKANRVVITATKTGSEKNATVFARYWAEAMREMLGAVPDPRGDREDGCAREDELQQQIGMRELQEEGDRDGRVDEPFQDALHRGAKCT